MKAGEAEKYHEVGGESGYDHPQVKASDKCHRSVTGYRNRHKSCGNDEVTE